MFVHEPSLATAKALLDMLAVTPPTPFAEQVCHSVHACIGFYVN
jgi:hypothetical protein